MATLVGILGSVTPPGRLHKALSAGLQATGMAFPRWETDLVDLAAHQMSFAAGRPIEQLDEDTAGVIGRIVAADAVILATPVYRASFSGALKNLLDLTPLNGLASKPCGIITMGATPHHYLGADWQLRGVLTWFGALVAPNSVYLTSADFVDGEQSAESRNDVKELMRTVLTLEIGLRQVAHGLGPRPLAAR